MLCERARWGKGWVCVHYQNLHPQIRRVGAPRSCPEPRKSKDRCLTPHRSEGRLHARAGQIRQCGEMRSDGKTTIRVGLLAGCDLPGACGDLSNLYRVQYQSASFRICGRPERFLREFFSWRRIVFPAVDCQLVPEVSKILEQFLDVGEADGPCAGRCFGIGVLRAGRL
jgi:hypothetical protein